MQTHKALKELADQVNKARDTITFTYSGSSGALTCRRLLGTGALLVIRINGGWIRVTREDIQVLACKLASHVRNYCLVGWTAVDPLYEKKIHAYPASSPGGIRLRIVTRRRVYSVDLGPTPTWDLLRYLNDVLEY